MKNIFSKTTEKRTQNGLKTDSKRTNYGIRILIFAFLTLGFGQMWADDKGFYEVYMVYDKNGTEYNYTYNGSNGSMDLGTITSSFKIKQMYLKVWDNWGDQAFDAGQSGLGYKTQSGSDTDYKTNTRSSDSDHDYELQHTNMNLTIASNTNPSGNYTFTHWWFAGGTYTSTYYLKNGSSNCAFTYKILPPAVKSGTVAISATNTAPGSGTGLTSGSPIILISGMASTLTITATQNHTDANSALWCKFGTGSYSSTTTYNIASGTTTSNQTLALAVKYRNNSASLDGAETTTTIYYKWAAPAPAVTMTSVTPSTSIVAGNDITLVGTRANSSNAISFQYSTNSGSTWTDISPKTTSGDSPKTITWTMPDAHGATQTFLFRAKLAEATPIYSSASSGVTVYNTKTIHVRNINDWDPMKVYRYSDSAEETTWPGNTTGLTHTQGQWYDVVLTSQWPYFILDNNNNGSQIKGNKNYTYSLSISDGGYYAIQEGYGTNLTLTSSTAPAAPTATTNEATVNSATLLTFNYSVESNRDKTTPGVAYKQSDSNIADPANIYSSGTRFEAAAINGNASGTFSNKTITAGKDYYYVAYGINGFGTTYGDIRKIRTTGITFNKKGGDSGSGDFVAVGGKTISAITAPSKTGYTFAGYWTTENDESGTKYYNADGSAAVANWPTNLSASLTLYAHWTPNKYDVTLKVNGGTGTDNQVVQATYDAAMPLVIKTAGTAIDIPTKTGYTLLGYWDATSGGNQYYAYSGSLSSYRTWNKTSDADLYARWQANTYTLTLYKNDGSATSTPATATYDATISVTPPTRTGYTFTGYWTAASGGTKIIETDGHFVNTVVSGYVASGRKWQRTSDTNLHAQWTVNTYTITLNHGTGGSGSGTATIDYDATSCKTWTETEEIVQTGYHINGWYDNSTSTKVLNEDHSFAGDNVSGFITSGKWSKAANCTLQAWWDPNNYTVTLEVDEDHKGDIASATTSHTVTFNTVTTNIPNLPTAEDTYGLDGYYTDHNGAGTKVINGDGTFIASVDGYTDGAKKWIRADGVTLYAYYKEAEITEITFSPGNIVAPSATVTVTATIEPIPAGTTTICWRVLYSNDNPLDPQPTFTPVSGGTVSFPAHSASGSYKVEATLRKGTGCGGDEIHTYVAPFQVAGDHTVTVQYKCGDVTLQASKAITGKPLTWSEEITPDEIFGYTFEKWVAGDGVSMTINGGETTIETGGETTGKAGTHAIQIKAIYDGKLTAKYTKKSIIYFKNTLGWSNVYVNIMSNTYWSAYNGSGNKNNYHSRNQQMTLLEGTDDIYYLEYSGSTSAYMSFTSMSQDNYENFWAGDGDHLQVVYPTHPFDDQGEQTNYGYNAGTPMFVPTAGQTPVDKHIVNNGRASYYNKGYWRKYDPIQGETGYTLKVYNKTSSDGRTELKSIKFVESDVPGQLFKAVANLEAAGGYGIKFERDNNMLYTNTTGHLHRTGDAVITDKQNDNYAAIWIKATAAGDYTFAITINGDGKLCIQAEFPVATNDYRVIYTDNDTWTKAHTARTWIHPSRIITAEENAVDTISFFVSKGHSPEFKIQQVNEINETTGAITWTDVTSWTSCNDVTATGIYNFIFTQDGSKNISFTKKEPYTGVFYIRTNCAGASKWDNYRGAADHTITYSEYSITHGGYSHYFTHWVEASDANSKNVKFCIANDYSPCISDTLTRETASGEWTNITHHIDVYGNILTDANVRFMWNQSTNKISRAYVDGAQGKGSNNFLYMLSTDGKIRKADESALVDNKVAFSDNENWIYEANIQAQPNAAIKLLSNWGTSNTITQYFKGSSSSTEDLIDGSGDNWYNIRLLYDFKTNRLVAAMVPTGNIDDPTPIHADVMFIREHQGDIDQLTFTEDGSITDIETAYAVMRFNKWTLNNKEKTGSHNPLASPASIYERSLYYVSFPFRVKLSEVFGFGTYGQHWIIQRYRGDLRAQQGYWAESAGFWEFIWNRNGEIYLEPDQGYILTLETELLGENSDVWGPNSRSSQIELFFPSYGTMPNITNTSITQTLPAHKCTINRAETEGLPDTPYPSTSYNRTIFDSHWNIMSVPTYVNANNPSLATTSWLANDSCPKFLYTWNPDDNTLTATSGTGFMYHAMHAYTVQYYGNVTWTTSVSPAAAPQRNTEYRGEYEFCLEVQQDEQMIDRTFVRLSDDENVTTGFEFGEDMTKQFNSRKANIFTIAGNTSLGGNSLPLSTTQTTVVPVGVSIKNAGDYTFAIPEGTEGIGVTLVDNETGVRTSLSALSYTVNLTAGDYTGRFVLEISPIAQTPTGVETVTGEGLPVTGVRKVMIDGILYIVKDGKMYDARGARVQ